MLEENFCSGRCTTNGIGTGRGFVTEPKNGRDLDLESKSGCGLGCNANFNELASGIGFGDHQNGFSSSISQGVGWGKGCIDDSKDGTGTDVLSFWHLCN